MKQEWIDAVLDQLVPKLLADQRFHDDGHLVNRFHTEVKTWKATDRIRPVIEIGNELAAADCLLGLLPENDRLHYEPAIVGTPKRIDFLQVRANGERHWAEVKTVAPTWVDDEDGWQRFVRIAQSFPENAKLVVAREWAGAAIAGQFIKARWSFIARTAEVEARAALIPEAQKGPVSLMLCSTGSAWYPDQLEDFADFYRTGRHRADDWMSNATNRYMQEEGITFARSLAGFHYLARKHESVFADDLRLHVAGPPAGS